MSPIPLDLSRANQIVGACTADRWENASTEVASTRHHPTESPTQLSRSSIEGLGAMGDTDIVSS